jgi:hypothetical protein
MYRLTIYANDGEKTVDEFEDEDELREQVESSVNDLENREIKSFVVSRVSGRTYEKPFWEKGN